VPRDFKFEPCDFEIPTLSNLKSGWPNILDGAVRHAVAVEEQYLHFHMFVLKNTRHTRHGELDTQIVPQRLVLTVRSGAIKTALLLCASIAEASLRSLAEQRALVIHRNPRQRTFGLVLAAWQFGNHRPRPEVRPIWGELSELRDLRNNVHLHKAAYDTAADYQSIIDHELHLFSEASKVLAHLRHIPPK
jgi:hypothetical protein